MMYNDSWLMCKIYTIVIKTRKNISRVSLKTSRFSLSLSFSSFYFSINIAYDEAKTDLLIGEDRSNVDDDDDEEEEKRAGHAAVTLHLRNEVLHSRALPFLVYKLSIVAISRTLMGF